MGGILKNPLPPEAIQKEEDISKESIKEFRKQVYKNTQLNAKLTSKKDLNALNASFSSDSMSSSGSSEQDDLVAAIREKQKSTGLPRDSLLLKHEHDQQQQQQEQFSSGSGISEEQEQEQEQERLQWNQQNLEANEITKQQFQDIHVDEPKTPYQGAVDPHGEYYRVDDEDEVGLDGDEEMKESGADGMSTGQTTTATAGVSTGSSGVGSGNDLDDLNDFSLGEPEISLDRQKELESGGGGGGVEVVMADEDSEAKEEETAEERHRRFEEMRRKHYDLREVFKNGKFHQDFDEDEDEDDEEDEDVGDVDEMQ